PRAQGLVRGREGLRALGGGDVLVLESPGEASPSLPSALPAGFLDEDAAHRLGGRREEVAPAVPAPWIARPDQPEVSLVDQGRRLERVTGPLLGQSPGGELAQLVVDKRQQSLTCVAVAVLDGGEDTGDLVHHGGVRSPRLGPQSLRSLVIVARHKNAHEAMKRAAYQY